MVGLARIFFFILIEHTHTDMVGLARIFFFEQTSRTTIQNIIL